MAPDTSTWQPFVRCGVAAYYRAVSSSLSLGHYTLVAEIARGTFGRLWTACHARDDGEAEGVLLRRLSKKAPLDDTAIDAIRGAAERATTVAVTGVAAVRGPEDTGEELAVIFEHSNGKDLRSLLALATLKRATMQPATAIHVVASMLEAAAGLRRELGVELGSAVIGPDSVFICEDGSVRLLDAGIAASIARSPGNAEFLQLIPYCAPEEFADVPEFSQCDVFRAGVLLWEMLSGKRLFSAHTSRAAIDQLQKTPVPPLQGIDPAISEIVFGALERDRRARFASVEEMASALANLELPSEGEAELVVWMQELVGITLGSQQRALRRATAKVVRHAGEPPAIVKPVRPRPPEFRKHVEVTERIEVPMPPAFELASSEATRQVDVVVPPEARRDEQVPNRRRPTATLLGVPAPAILPAKRPLPPPPAPRALSEETGVTRVDDVDPRFRLAAAAPFDDSAVTLLEDIVEPGEGAVALAPPNLPTEAEAELGTEPAMPPFVTDSISNVPDSPSSAPPLRPATDTISGLLALSHAGSMTEVDRVDELATDVTDVPPWDESARERNKKYRAYVAAIVAALATLLVAAVVLAWVKSEKKPATEPAANTAAAAAPEIPASAGSVAQAEAPAAPLAMADPTQSAPPDVESVGPPAAASSEPLPTPAKSALAPAKSTSGAKPKLTPAQLAHAKKTKLAKDGKKKLDASKKSKKTKPKKQTPKKPPKKAKK